MQEQNLLLWINAHWRVADVKLDALVKSPVSARKVSWSYGQQWQDSGMTGNRRIPQLNWVMGWSNSIHDCGMLYKVVPVIKNLEKEQTSVEGRCHGRRKWGEKNYWSSKKMLVPSKPGPAHEEKCNKKMKIGTVIVYEEKAIEFTDK